MIPILLPIISAMIAILLLTSKDLKKRKKDEIK